MMANIGLGWFMWLNSPFQRTFGATPEAGEGHRGQCGECCCIRVRCIFTFHLHEAPAIAIPLKTSNTSSQDLPKGSWWQWEVQMPCATSKHFLQVPEPCPKLIKQCRELIQGQVLLSPNPHSEKELQKLP